MNRVWVPLARKRRRSEGSHERDCETSCVRLAVLRGRGPDGRCAGVRR